MMLVTRLATGQKQAYPADYFQFPLYPGKSNTLAGVLGDLRSNHFHAGIDIRTRQAEGLPVTAAADGYISRVAVQRGGYGNVIYIRHPNGMTTLYAHLQKFEGALGRYVREEQYRKQTFEIELEPAPGVFPVQKGALIALSGNTGGSQGPHLHFEIRDEKNNYLNPLAFGFKEIRDETPPRFVSVALQPMDLNARVNGTFERQVFVPQVKKGVRGASLKDTLRATGFIGLELQAFDRMDGTGFNYGLSCIEVKMDGREVFTYNMEKFPVTITRDYNHLINYGARIEDGVRYYKCYNPDGNRFDLYRTDQYRGKLLIADTLVHEIRILISDSYENSEELVFFVRGESVAAPGDNRSEPGDPESTGPAALFASPQGHFVNVLAEGYRAARPQAVAYSRGRRQVFTTGYNQPGGVRFLWDLRNGLPDSIGVGNMRVALSYKAKIAPEVEENYNAGPCSIRFDANSLFDTLYLAVKQTGNTLRLNESTEPLKGGIEVTYRPETVPGSQERTHIYRLLNGNEYFVGGVWKEGSIRFNTRELGVFYPLTDTIPPKIRLVEHSKSRIRAYISDNLSGIDSFRALVNGQWVLMNYEYKQQYLWSEKLDEGAAFEGEVLLEVRDRAGNVGMIRKEIAEPVVKKKTGRRRR